MQVAKMPFGRGLLLGLIQNKLLVTIIVIIVIIC